MSYPPYPPNQIPGYYPPAPSNQIPGPSISYSQQSMAYPAPNPQYQQAMPYSPLPAPFAFPQSAQPPLPQPGPTSRCLNVKNGGVSRPQILITDSLTSMPLYTFTFPKRSHLSSEPHIAVTGPSGAPIATIRFHSMSDDIDLVIHGHATSLKTNGLTSSHGMVSRVPGVGKLKWKNQKGGEIRCTDEKGEAVARLEVATWGKVKKVCEI